MARLQMMVFLLFLSFISNVCIQEAYIYICVCVCVIVMVFQIQIHSGYQNNNPHTSLSIQRVFLSFLPNSQSCIIFMFSFVVYFLTVAALAVLSNIAVCHYLGGYTVNLHSFNTEPKQHLKYQTELFIQFMRYFITIHNSHQICLCHLVCLSQY